MTPPAINAPRTRILKTKEGHFMPQFSCDGLSYYDIVLQPCYSIQGAILASHAFLEPTKRVSTMGELVK
jgi:hypothetical protein